MALEPADGATAFSPEVQVAIAREREHVAEQRTRLAESAPTGWGIATVSSRIPGEALFVITPQADDLSPEDVILTDLAGAAVPFTPGWESEPPASAGEHADAYRDSAGIGGVADLDDGTDRILAARGDAAAAVDAVLDAAKDVPGTTPGEAHHP